MTENDQQAMLDRAGLLSTYTVNLQHIGIKARWRTPGLFGPRKVTMWFPLYHPTVPQPARRWNPAKYWRPRT